MTSDRDDNKIKAILALIYIVLNLDQLCPLGVSTSHSNPWHDTSMFEMDWPEGVRAALTVLRIFRRMEEVNGWVCLFEESLCALVEELTPEDKNREVDYIEIRCVCLSSYHKEGSTIFPDYCLKSKAWPVCMFKSGH